ncbi:MAG: hypothetical protein QOI08_1620, partial [Actinomycetota bacterium]|nr:hypothetical protein [Actinomycetota bacterium]
TEELTANGRVQHFSSVAVSGQ